MDSGATGWLKNICYCKQGVIIFIVQNKLVLCFGTAHGQINNRVLRAFTANAGIGGAAIGMAKRQLLITLIILVLYILMNVM